MKTGRLFLLGNMRLEHDGGVIPLRTKGEQRWLALLAYLALERRKIDRRTLARLIWQYEDKPLDRLRRHTLAELKQKFDPSLLEITPDSVQLNTDALWVDAYEYELALGDLTDQANDTPAIDAALALYTGDLLEGYTFPEIGLFSEWLESKTASLRDLFTTTIARQTLDSFQAGDLARAEGYAALWTERKPGDVQAYAWLLNIYEKQGNSGASSRYLPRFKRVLAKYGITRADLYRAQTQIKSIAANGASAKAPIKKTPLKAIGMPDQARGNPPFYQDYLDVLFNLAARDPAQAVKYSANISRILFDLMDNPHHVDQMLSEVERLILDGDQGTNPETEFRLTLQRLRIYRALALTEKAVQLVDAFGDDSPPLATTDHETRSDWLRNRALIRCWIQGDYKRALADFEKARSESVFAGRLDWEVGIIADMGLVYWNQGNYALAEQYIKFGKEQFMQIGGHDLSMIRCIGNLALVYLFQGKLEQAFENVSQQLNLATSLAYSSEIRRATGNRGIIQFHLGQYDAAIADLDVSTRMTKADNEGYVNNLINMSRCYRAKNNQPLAYELADTALTQAIAKGYGGIKIVAQRVLAEVSPPKQAIALLKEAAKSAHERQRHFDEAACLLLLTEYMHDARSQNANWKRASKILETLGAEYWLEKSPFELPAL